jgi:hypothetical protein
MSDLNENVLDLIDKIDSNDNIEAENLFNNILQTKIDELLDAAKTEVASSMFNTQECADCDAEVNEALKGGQHKIDMNKNGKLDAMDFKMLRGKKKGMKEEVESVDEASYSAKMARAGKDIGKPGKMFSKIAAKASRKYGKERGAKIAGAVLAKLRKKGK